MFNLGEYDEDEAKEIRTFLSDAGIRIELKPSLVIFEEQTSSLHGRLSQLKSLTKDMDDYERYLSVLKSVLPRSTTEEEFEELFMEELDPTMTEKRNKIRRSLRIRKAFQKLRRNPWISIQQNGWAFY